MASLLLGCASQSSDQEADGYKRFLTVNDQFAFGCEDHLKALNYIQQVHVDGDAVEMPELIKQAAFTLVNAKRLAAPYFSDHEDKNAAVKFLIHYITYELSTKVQGSLDKTIDSLSENKELCSLVDEMTGSLKEVALMPRYADWTKRHLSTLVHKTLFRYIVASLDPHSQVMEPIEHEYLARNLNDQIKRGRSENVFQRTFTKGNPYYVIEHADDMRAEWISPVDRILKIEIMNFTSDTAESFKSLYESFVRGEGLSGLVIDLRRNRGGNAFEVAELADLFIKKGLIFYMQERSTNGWLAHKRYAAEGNELPHLTGLPIFVLVSRFTASAAEVFASTMQDHQKGMIVGEQTFGKGTGQRNAMLKDLLIEGGVASSMIMMLTQLYTYSPSGVPIQMTGVIPDIDVDDADYYAHMASIDFIGLKTHYEAFLPNKLSTPEVTATGFKRLDAPWVAEWSSLKDSLTTYYEGLGNAFSLETAQLFLANTIQ